MKTELDKVVEEFKKADLEKAAELKKMEPYLNAQLRNVEKVDKKIAFFEEQIKRLEKEKQSELTKMEELLTLAVINSWALDNGYTVLQDNKRSVEVIDAASFLKWLKTNCEPQEVMEFFKDALKKSNLKGFCDKKFNELRTKGEIEPTIDGVNFGQITYRRLTTKRKSNGKQIDKRNSSKRKNGKI